MRTFSALHVLLLLLLLLAYQCSNAQDYVITTKGDSIPGEVKMNVSAEKSVVVIDQNKNKTRFTLFQVRHFSFKGNLYYPMRFNEGYTFMKLLKKGYLSLYAYQVENQNTYDGLFLKKLDGASLDVPNLTFKKSVSKFLEDCPAVVEKLNDNIYSKRALPLLVDDYNQCIDEKSKNAFEQQTITLQPANHEITSQWKNLILKIQQVDFEGKSDALDMAMDIQKKINYNEDLPKFLVEGFKNALSKTTLLEESEKIISDYEKGKE